MQLCSNQSLIKGNLRCEFIQVTFNIRISKAQKRNCFNIMEIMERSNKDLLQAYDATIQGWVHALDLRDKETEGHSRLVTEITVNLASQWRCFFS